MLIACDDDTNASILLRERELEGKRTAAYGIVHSALDQWPTFFSEIKRIFGEDPLQLLPGRHNTLNMIAAITVLQAIDHLDIKAVRALTTFKGVARRMEMLGETANGVSIYSDYGHHPTAIRSTLQGARSRFPGQAIWAVWQPHTYSRTHLLAHEFAHAFKDADHALITDIYAAREQPVPGPSEVDIAACAHEFGHPDARHTGDLTATAAVLRAETKPSDVVIIFSAGDGPKIGEMLLKSG